MSFQQYLESERLTFTWWQLDDAEELFARCSSDPVVTRFLIWPTHKTVDETGEMIRDRVARREQGRACNWMIRRRDSSELVGSIGCRLEGRLAEVGYYLAHNAWGHGYATEAARTFMSLCISAPQIARVHATCDVENVASARVLEKAGLEREATLRRYLVAPNIGDEPRDAFMYAKIRDD